MGDSDTVDSMRDDFPFAGNPRRRFPYNAAMKIASWNVNSLKVRLPHLTQWLADAQPDIVALQETKLEDAKFPVD